MSNTYVFRTPKLWMEDNAIQQLDQACGLPDVVAGIGLPDLHVSKYGPVGACILTKNTIYPYFPGSDIGCGFLFSQLNIKLHKFSRDKVIKKLRHLTQGANPDLWEKYHISPRFEESMGSIGLGNHFTEFTQVTPLSKDCPVSPDFVYLFVHSGSRGLGTSIITEFNKKSQQANVSPTSPIGQWYMSEHSYALKWSQMNREIIAHHFASFLGYNFTTIFNDQHNFIEPVTLDGNSFYLHRKGANKATNLFIVSGSRGTDSYLCTRGPLTKNAFWSVSHGCGRKYRRSDMEGRVDLTKPNNVICNKKSLLLEEHPFAYKSIEQVMDTLVSHQLAAPLAKLTPIVNFKTLENDEKYAQ